MRKLLVLAAAMAGLAAGLPGLLAAPARAAGIPAAVTDCDLHARLTRHYPVAELRQALAGIPAEISEYSNCHDIIQRQLLLQLGQLPGRGAGSGGGGGTFLPVWLIIVLAVLVAGAGGLGVAWVRQRRAG